jgi:hypothetical protein
VTPCPATLGTFVCATGHLLSDILYGVVDKNLGVGIVLFKVQVLLAIDKDKVREEEDNGRRNRGMGKRCGGGDWNLFYNECRIGKRRPVSGVATDSDKEETDTRRDEARIMLGISSNSNSETNAGSVNNSYMTHCRKCGEAIPIQQSV